MPLLVIVDAAISIAAGVLLSEIAETAYAHFYAYNAGVEIHELSEAYGFGFFGMLFQITAFLVSAATIFYLLLKRRFGRP